LHSYGLRMKIDSFEQMGVVLRAARVALNVPLADLAETLETSQTLLRRQEQGNSTVALKKLFATMQELGIEMHLSLPPSIDESSIDLDGKTAQRKRARP
jgi:transcriptional regulator with XRE-family HTH domain